VKNKVFLANKNGVHLLQKKFVGVQPFIAANKTKDN
jgi:filamentous hemagglutinin family protein